MNDRLAVPSAASAPADAPIDRAGVNPLRDELIDAGLLVSTGIQGLFGRSERFERV
ncbi:hypothetical protein JAO06_30015, partial [Burkholderia multivorans]|nr:hypothetical protein [Burkholderia multivorans]